VQFPVLNALLGDPLSAAGQVCSCLRYRRKAKIKKDLQMQLFFLICQYIALQ